MLIAFLALFQTVIGLYNNDFVQNSVNPDFNLHKSIQTIEKPYLKAEDTDKIFFLPGTQPEQNGPLKSTSNIDITIDGHVYDSITGLPLQNAKEEFYNKTNMQLQYTTFTDNAGYYNAPFFYVGQKEHKQNLEDKLYPNPSQGQTNIVFNAAETGTYKGGEWCSYRHNTMINRYMAY